MVHCPKNKFNCGWMKIAPLTVVPMVSNTTNVMTLLCVHGLYCAKNLLVVSTMLLWIVSQTCTLNPFVVPKVLDLVRTVVVAVAAVVLAAVVAAAVMAAAVVAAAVVAAAVVAAAVVAAAVVAIVIMVWYHD